MDIVLLAGLFPNQIKQEILIKSKGVIQFAANNLQWSIVNGLDYCNKYPIKIINALYIGSYPKLYSDIRIREFKFVHKSGANDINVGFINLIGYKIFDRKYKIEKELMKWAQIEKEQKVIIIYAMHIPFIAAAIKTKILKPWIKICLIIPDLPEYMSDSNNIIYKMLKKIEISWLNKNLKFIDSFVLLSEHMYKELKIGNRPWVTVEGIFNENNYMDKSQIFINESIANMKIILYTGTLSKRYGILDLLEAFALIKESNYQLWICGEGDTKEIIIKKAEEDKRIVYWGQLEQDRIIQLQKSATVLVNPRKEEGKFTKFSFPSKTIEYMASGTPCIINKLSGIPSEYYSFVLVPDDSKVESLCRKIIEVCEMKESKRIEIGKKAKEFIELKKNPNAQCQKIYDMINKLF